MIAPYEKDGYAFVGCPSRLGQVSITGPATGTKWTIGTSGNWINSEDAAQLVEKTEEVWCWRSSQMITIHPVIYQNPSFHQIKEFFGGN